MFYDTFYGLCSKNGITPNKACVDCGISRTSVAKWKKGATPNGATVAKLADYFGVTADFLLGGGQKGTPAGVPAGVSDEDIKFALSGGDGVITDAQFEEVKKFVQFIKERDKLDQK